MITKEAEELFRFIADQVEVLLRTHHPDSLSRSETVEVFSLGLTFSFPVYQTAINSGILLRWTKGFDIPSVIGEDVCKLLQHQLDLRKLPVKVTALVNDAAGTIMSRAYSLPIDQMRTSIGTIFGTGTNGVYLEKLSKIRKPLHGRFDGSTLPWQVVIWKPNFPVGDTDFLWKFASCDVKRIASGGCWPISRNSARRKYAGMSESRYRPQAWGLGQKEGDTAWMALSASNWPSLMILSFSPVVTGKNLQPDYLEHMWEETLRK